MSTISKIISLHGSKLKRTLGVLHEEGTVV